MSPMDPPPTGCTYPAVALTCGYQYYEDALVPPAPPSNSPELVPTPKSTGCGALIHSSATMTMAHTWRAPAAGVTSTVIPLEARYFDLGATTLLQLGALADCGCAMDGVGCQLYGNALGARFSPCAAHAHPPAAFGYKYTFLPNAVWPRPSSTSSSSNSSSAPPSPASTTPTPRNPPASHGRIHSIVEREVQAYESLAHTAFPPQRRLDAQSLGVPRDFAPRRGSYTDTDVFEGYEAWYGAAEPARGVREGSDARLGVGSGSGVR